MDHQLPIYLCNLGSIDGQSYETKTAMTGIAPQFGPGGYEIQISDLPIASTKTLWIQLVDPALLPISDKIYFDTYAECDKNLTIINFVQVK
jgi:hypothetical protein